MGAYHSYAVEWALEMASSNNDPTVDNIYDARRHAFWSAMMAQEFGQTEAKWWGDAHERYRPTDEALSVCMDLHNNGVGRAIAASFNGVYHNILQVKAAVLASTSLRPAPECD